MAGEIPVYGPGTTNKIIPWFTVTNAPYNYSLAPYLGNRLTWGTWGNENQPVTFPMGKSDLEYTLAQDYNNPNHIRQTNPMLIGYKLGENNETNPMLIEQSNMNAFQWGQSLVTSQIKDQKIATIAQTLGSIEGKLSKLLQSDKLTEGQKTKIQNLIEKIQAKKAEIQEKLKAELSTEELEAIQGEVIELQKEISEEMGKIIKEVEGKDSTDNSSDNSTPVTADDAKNIEDKHKKELTAAIDIIKDIYQGALGSWGTDYETIRKGTGKINKNNAATVVLAWDQQYKAMTGKGLVETLFDEEWGWNPSLQKRDDNNKTDNSKAKNIDMVWNIVSSLEEKAKEVGVYNELAGAFTIAYDELDDTFVDEKAVISAVDQIAKKVYEAQSEQAIKDLQSDKKAESDKKAKNDKADENKKAAEAEKQAWELFKTDLKEIYKDDKLEVSEKVQYKDGKFQIRILGDVYEGKTMKELAKAIKDAGLDPKEYLVKKHVNIAC